MQENSQHQTELDTEDYNVLVGDIGDLVDSLQGWLLYWKSLQEESN